MTTSPIRQGCRLKRFEETVTMLGKRLDDLGRQVIRYEGYAFGSRYETEDVADAFKHATSCPCRRLAGPGLQLKLKE